MPKTIVLRFRDMLADTIAEHQKCIDQSGYTWWGWWRKKTEPERFDELVEFGKILKETSTFIGLYDKSQQRFFCADADSSVFATPNQYLESPDSVTTPEYYRNEKLPAWFRIRRIEAVREARFVELFGTVPIGDETFYPIGDAVAPRTGEAAPIDNRGMRLRGSTILHLTDIHFGSDFGFQFTQQPGQLPLLQTITQDLDAISAEQIGLVVVSGDITSKGDASHLFNNGLPFLEQLCGHLRLDHNHVIIVPGNHDISFKEFTPTYDHERAYNTFLQSFYGTVTQQHRLLRYELPNGRPLEVLTISSVKLRTKETSNYGWVDWQACETLLKTAGVPPPGTLRMAVLHHHLVSTLRDEKLPDAAYPDGSVSVTLNSGAVIEGLQRYGFDLVLHGHQHTPGLYRVARGRVGDGTLALQYLDRPLYAMAGGSAGARADRIDGEIRDNTYGLLRIAPTVVEARVRAFNPSGIARDLFSASLKV